MGGSHPHTKEREGRHSQRARRKVGDPAGEQVPRRAADLEPFGPHFELASLPNIGFAVADSRDREHRGTEARCLNRGTTYRSGIRPLLHCLAQCLRAPADERDETKGTLDDGREHQLATVPESMMGSFMADHRVEAGLVQLCNESGRDDDLRLATRHPHRDEYGHWNHNELEVTFVEMLPEPRFDASAARAPASVHEGAHRQDRQRDDKHGRGPAHRGLNPREAAESVTRATD